ncbi:hypothetical protein Pfo_015434 [Paulownia fortunei]|nr:hypothetical protein Pfo_015434 [Paulownia fortunei]
MAARQGSDPAAGRSLIRSASSRLQFRHPQVLDRKVGRVLLFLLTFSSSSFQTSSRTSKSLVYSRFCSSFS